ncbi:MAG: hypothetical protein MPK62_02035 [Alphaproteobacteria bacterium]|nr:hypothetical protein [Alphaproteobacteria bacterium]
MRHYPSVPEFKYLCETVRWGPRNRQLQSARTYCEMADEELGRASPRKWMISQWLRIADFYYHAYVIQGTWPESRRRGDSQLNGMPEIGVVLQYETRARMLWLARLFSAFADTAIAEGAAAGGRRVASLLKRADFYYHAYMIKGEWNG